MKRFLLLLLLLPFFSKAQNKLYGSIGGEYYFGSSVGNGYGPHFSGSIGVSQKLHLGLGLSAIFFDGLKTVYPPVSAEISIFPLNYSAAVSPFISLNPGYSFYKAVSIWRSDSTVKKGGSTFFAGVGVHFPNLTNKSTFISVGYSAFGSSSQRFFQRDETLRNSHSKSSFGCFTIRAGIMFH